MEESVFNKLKAEFFPRRINPARPARIVSQASFEIAKNAAAQGWVKPDDPGGSLKPLGHTDAIISIDNPFVCGNDFVVVIDKIIITASLPVRSCHMRDLVEMVAGKPKVFRQSLRQCRFSAIAGTDNANPVAKVIHGGRL